jgi:hypothetical protein
MSLWLIYLPWVVVTVYSLMRFFRGTLLLLPLPAVRDFSLSFSPVPCLCSHSHQRHFHHLHFHFPPSFFLLPSFFFLLGFTSLSSALLHTLRSSYSLFCSPPPYSAPVRKTLPFSLSPYSHISNTFNTRRASFAHKTEMQCVLRCHPQRLLAQPPSLPLHSATTTKIVSASQRTSPLSFATSTSKHQQSRSLQTLSSSHSLTRGDKKSCLVGKGTTTTTAGQNSQDIRSLAGSRSTWFTRSMSTTTGCAGTKGQQITTTLSEVAHPGSSFFVHRFGNSCRRSFNSSSRAAPSSTTNNVRPFSTTASAYNNSNKRSSVTGLDSLQTWRRPYHYPSSKSSQEVRSLATMPSKPTLQAIPNSISDPATRLQRSMAAVPHHTIKNEIKLRCTEFDHKGNVKTTAGEFLKSDLCQQVSLSSSKKCRRAHFVRVNL